MSTVLWANLLQDGEVISEEGDKYALYNHTDRLDRIAKNLDLSSFAETCDTMDAQFYLSDEALSEGMESTNEVMALKEVSILVAEDQSLTSGLLEHVQKNQTRFGLFFNDHDVVVEELPQAMSFARSAKSLIAKFNFSVVM